jgi:hypothetical protein
MTQQNKQSKRWNIFARELEDILSAHDLHLGHLDDRAGIHREKVRRLQQSLLAPKSFPVLNPVELELLVETFDLSEEERVRLRAALLATAIERMLMDRIDQDNALLASEQIQTILRDTLLVQFEQESGIGSIRGEDSDSIEDTEGDITWKRAWKEYDEGNMALQLGYGMNSYSESVRCMRDAQGHFTEASTELDSLDDDWQSSQSWKVWRNEIDTGLALTRERLEDLGAE